MYGRLGLVTCSSLSALLLLNGCYALKRSSGAGQHPASTKRTVNPADVALPSGYRIEPVATGLTFPTGVAFDVQGTPHVVESGYAYGEVWTKPTLVRVEANNRVAEVAAGQKNGPWTGVAFHEGSFYVAEGGQLEGGRILRISPEGKMTALVSDLPSFGDHHSNGPVPGPDGWLYFGQGTASNSGVVGEDNAKFGWLKRKPEFHDIPCRDIVLTGENFTSGNSLTKDAKALMVTGAYQPFGTKTSYREVVAGAVPCSGAILRVQFEGGPVELVAWGFRNPFGLAFAPNGRLYVTDNGYDDRGSRPVWGTPDVLWAITPGLWYGWPDYTGGMPVNQRRFKAPGKEQPGWLLAEHPNSPPAPAALFAVHSSADGFDFSRNPQFGHTGEAFVALFGDDAPEAGKVLHSAGTKVVRVNVETGVIEEFAVNKGKMNAPASKLGRGGLERPLAARFSPSGDALYVVDFGVMNESSKGAQPRPGTGVLWRIVRAERRP